MEQTEVLGELTRMPEHVRDEAARERVLEAISRLAVRQRAAIISGDVRAVNRLFEALLQLQMGLSDLIARLPVEGKTESRAAVATHRVREQLRVNRALLGNGIAICDHLMATVASASAPAALFAGDA